MRCSVVCSKHWDVRFFQIVGHTIVVRPKLLRRAAAARPQDRAQNPTPFLVENHQLVLSATHLSALQWTLDRQDTAGQVGRKAFDLMGCRVELRSDEKAERKGYRPRFKLVNKERTLTFEVPSVRRAPPHHSLTFQSSSRACAKVATHRWGAWCCRVESRLLRSRSWSRPGPRCF